MKQWILIATAVCAGVIAADIIKTAVEAAAAAAYIDRMSTAVNTPRETPPAKPPPDRTETPTALDLKRRCEEFRDAVQNTGSTFAEEQRNATCAHYDTYLRTGRVPR